MLVCDVRTKKKSSTSRVLFVTT